MLCGLNPIVIDISEFQNNTFEFKSANILKKKLKSAGKNDVFSVLRGCVQKIIKRPVCLSSKHLLLYVSAILSIQDITKKETFKMLLTNLSNWPAKFSMYWKCVY